MKLKKNLTHTRKNYDTDTTVNSPNPPRMKSQIPTPSGLSSPQAPIEKSFFPLALYGITKIPTSTLGRQSANHRLSISSPTLCFGWASVFLSHTPNTIPTNHNPTTLTSPFHTLPSTCSCSIDPCLSITTKRKSYLWYSLLSCSHLFLSFTPKSRFFSSAASLSFL